MRRGPVTSWPGVRNQRETRRADDAAEVPRAYRSDGHQLEPDLAAAPARGGAVRRHRRPRAAQAPARHCSTSRRPGCCPSTGSSAPRSTTSTTTASARSHARRSTSSPRHGDAERRVGRVRVATSRYVCQSAGNEALAEGRRRARGRPRRRRRAASLPERPAGRGARGGAAGSARSAWPSGPASSWRSRSAPISRARSR